MFVGLLLTGVPIYFSANINNHYMLLVGNFRQSFGDFDGLCFWNIRATLTEVLLPSNSALQA